jgi:tripartite-type tricarboxylate transporter receptor subunit TctC
MKLSNRRQFLHLAVSAAALTATWSIVVAQTYPTRPITMINGFTAGAATDTIGRIIADRMERDPSVPPRLDRILDPRN